MEQVERLSKSQKKKVNAAIKQVSNSIRLQRISPLTETQTKFFNNYNKYDVLSLHGCPGTGKTYLAMFKALENLDEDDKYKTVKIIRSNVSVRDVGFLPGSAKDKMAAYEAPYQAICGELYGRGDAYEILKTKKILEFHPTAHMRGVTFKNCIVIIDECQNMSYQELNTLLTRVGENCKLILCGDVYQDDLTSTRYNETSGYKDILQVLKGVKSCRNFEFTVQDIVRSGFVKEYILAKIRFEKGDRVKPVQTMLTEIAESVANSQLI